MDIVRPLFLFVVFFLILSACSTTPVSDHPQRQRQSKFSVPLPQCALWDEKKDILATVYKEQIKRFGHPAVKLEEAASIGTYVNYLMPTLSSMDQFQSCYDERAAEEPDYRAKWILGFQLNKHGAMIKPCLHPGSTIDFKLEKCLVGKLQNWSFKGRIGTSRGQLLPTEVKHTYQFGFKNLKTIHVDIRYGRPKKIDGVRDPGEWKNANKFKVPVELLDKTKTTGYLFLMRDSKNLYIAFEFKNKIPVPTQSFFIGLGPKDIKDHNQEGVDYSVLLLNAKSELTYYDGIMTNRPPCLSKYRTKWKPCQGKDSKYGGTNDGSAKYQVRNGRAFYEFERPLKSEDEQNDVSLNPGEYRSLAINLMLYVNAHKHSNNGYPSEGKKLLIRIPNTKKKGF